MDVLEEFVGTYFILAGIFLLILSINNCSDLATFVVLSFGSLIMFIFGLSISYTFWIPKKKSSKKNKGEIKK